MEENNEELVKVENENVQNSETESNDTINTVKISSEAVATYAGIAIAEVSGVFGMSGALAGITEAISGKKSYTKGVKVDINEKEVKIDVNIIVEYGARIPDVAFEIQTKVKKSVETMTGLKVSEVNVNVQGVHAIAEKEEIKIETKSEEEA
jgi:uncharacterized alkaline shock family protein YloU